MTHVGAVNADYHNLYRVGDLRKDHPLYQMWQTLRRRYGSRVCKEWNDFWVFAFDMGVRPENYRLSRVDSSKPYCAANCFWKPPVCDGAYNLKDREHRNAYMREWNRRDLGKLKDRNLRKSHGITLDDYSKLLESQGGLCAICRGPERSIHRPTGKPYALAVDHCHATGAIRGLLCSFCNRAIGAFNDVSFIIRAAASYLDNHNDRPIS